MPAVHGDPDRIDQFATELTRFNAEVNTALSRLQGQFRTLGDTWNDVEHRRYAEQFQQSVRMIRQFLQDSEQHIPVLRGKAKALRAYLGS